MIEQWADLGVGVELDVRTLEAFDAWLDDPNGPGDIWWSGWVADYPDPETFVDPLLAMTPVHRDSALVDLLDRARLSRSQAERWGLYREADRRLVRELVSVVSLNQGTTGWPRVAGWTG